MGRYPIGLNFGTESGRAILVDVETGAHAGVPGLSVGHGHVHLPHDDD